MFSGELISELPQTMGSRIGIHFELLIRLLLVGALGVSLIGEIDMKSAHQLGSADCDRFLIFSERQSRPILHNLDRGCQNAQKGRFKFDQNFIEFRYSVPKLELCIIPQPILIRPEFPNFHKKSLGKKRMEKQNPRPNSWRPPKKNLQKRPLGKLG